MGRASQYSADLCHPWCRGEPAGTHGAACVVVDDVGAAGGTRLVRSTELVMTTGVEPSSGSAHWVQRGSRPHARNTIPTLDAQII